MIKQRFSSFLMMSVLAVGSTGVLAAEAAEQKCQQLYDDGRYASAYEACLPVADDGSAIASFVLSNLHARGLGGAKADVAEALKRLRAAAEAGYPPASYNLGALYENGEVVDQSLNDAFSWYQRGAEAGHNDSQLKTGVMLLKGDGVRADYEKAQEWLEKAAIGGNSNAQVTLAILQATAGDKQALHWYQQAAEQNNAFALYQLADVYAEGKLGEQIDYNKALRLAKQSVQLGRLSSKRLVEELEGKMAATKVVVAEPAEQPASNDKPVDKKLITAGLLTPEKLEPVKPSSVKKEALKTAAAKKEPAKLAAAADVKKLVTAKKPASIPANHRDRTWLMQQPNQRIVMQLAQVTSEDAIGRYLKKYDLENQVDYYRARTRAGLVYVLLYHRNTETVGESKQIAKQVLHPAVQKGVWYRRFSTLQADYVAPDA